MNWFKKLSFNKVLTVATGVASGLLATSPHTEAAAALGTAALMFGFGSTKEYLAARNAAALAKQLAQGLKK